MMTNPPRVRLLLLTALFFGLAPISRAADPLVTAKGIYTSAIELGDLDLPNCRTYCDGQEIELDTYALKAALGLGKSESSLQIQRPKKTAGDKPGDAGTSQQNRRAKFEYQIAFNKPITVGMLDFDFQGEAHGYKLRYLSGDTNVKPAAAVAKAWIEAAPRQPLPPGTKIRAISVSEERDNGPSILRRAVILKKRLASLTPDAVGIAERAPFGSDPNAIPAGHAWRNTGMDSSPGAVQKLQRGAVSSALPSWYILSWDEKQSIAGLLLESNAREFQLYSYIGDPSANPGLAARADWKRFDFTTISQTELSGESRPVRRRIEFAPLSTAAIKLEITSTGGSPIAAIDRFDALYDLGDKPAAERSSKLPQPFEIAYEQPATGRLTMVITDAQGKHIRNLVAQVDRQQGPQTEAWDLKDETGATVPPGEYKFKAITAPQVELHYGMTVIPTQPGVAGDRTPWLQDVSGPHGWMADHASHTSGIALGKHVYFGAPGVESGVSFIECDLDGRKLWAKHSFAGFTGLKSLAADKDAIYIYEQSYLDRMDPTTHEIRRLATLVSPTRQGEPQAMAAYDGKVYLAFRSHVPMLENATLAQTVDLDRCQPMYPKEIPDVLGNRRVQPNPRQEFLRLLRLSGAPSGQPGGQRGDRPEAHFPIYLESTFGTERYQYIVVAFKEPVPLGSVVFPYPHGREKIELSVLKARAAWPPNAKQETEWTPFESSGAAGWQCLAAPAGTLTRALRLRFTRTGDENEPEDDVLDVAANDPLDKTSIDKDSPDKEKVPSDFDALDAGPKKAEGLLAGPAKNKWFARIEGLKLLRRRFNSLLPTATIRVNSGEIDKLGQWDAQRTAPLSVEQPGVYVLEWKDPQKVAGLAVREIDGEETRVDVWTGDEGAPVELEGQENWREVAIYKQPRRDSYEPSFNRNSDARYLDGYIDFHEAISTRAVRLRVVSQWADNGHQGTDTMRTDLGGRELDARRCRIWGVAPLEYLGGEPPVQESVHQRIEVRDGNTGELSADLAGEVDYGLAFDPAGKLYGIRAGKIMQVDTNTGHATPAYTAAAEAGRIAFDKAGLCYVFVWDKKVIEVYSPAGKLVRTIGHPGGQKPGPWDPQKFLHVSDMFIDDADGLWVVEAQHLPRRIVHYKTDGTLVKEMLGNTNYGGAGVLSRYDKSLVYHGHVQYQLDWKTGRARIKGLMAEGMPEDLIPVRVGDRLYLASTPLSHNATQPTGVVYLYDDKTATARLVAAFGEASAMNELKRGDILALLKGGQSLKECTFNWSDTNGNGKVDPAEVIFEDKTSERTSGLGRFDKSLGCMGGHTRYEVEKFLADGTPIYKKSTVPAAGYYRLDDGNTLNFRVSLEKSLVRGPSGEKDETHVSAPDGTRLWGYPTDHPGVSGLWVPPWSPGYVSNEFGIIGHETATEGDLGEFVVVHANNGQWKIWTADGLLAGSIMLHLGDPTSRSVQAFTNAEPGARLDRLTSGQEHFHGHFTKNEQDGKYYALWGHNLISLLEVRGLEKFRRLSGDVKVTVDDVRRVRAAEEEQARRTVKSRAKQIECVPIEGDEVPKVASVGDLDFGMAYDQANLYLKWSVSNQGPLKNTGVDFQRIFKTGACLDLQMSTDPVANAARTRPAKGDFRLLLTYVEGKPQVVLYQPVLPGTSPAEAWETRTEAAGVTTFDRVTLCKNVTVRMTTRKEQPNTYSVLAIVPLKTIGLEIRDGLQLKLDWGVLTTESGNAVRQRLYWNNQLANGTADEALEARLEPHLWGSVIFHAQSANNRRLSDTLPDVKDKASKTSVDDLLDDLKPGK